MQIDNRRLLVEYPEPPSIMREPLSARKVLGLARYFGPAAIVASMSLGAGETVLSARSGAWARYDLLWLILLATLVKQIILQYGVGRYTVITGEDMGVAFTRVPGPRGWFNFLILAVEVFTCAFFASAIAGSLGGLAATLAGRGTPQAWAFLMLVITIGAGTVVSFAGLQKTQVAICALMVATILIAAVACQPSLIEILKGLFGFGRFPRFPEWVLQVAPEFKTRSYLLEAATVFGYTGGVMGGYVVYSSWVRENRWGLAGSPRISEVDDLARSSRTLGYLPVDAAQVKKGLTHLQFVLTDVLLGGAVMLLVTGGFMVAGAVILNPAHLVPTGFTLLQYQAEFFRSISEALVPVYYGCVFLVLAGSLYGFPELYTRLLVSMTGYVFPGIQKVRYRALLVAVGILQILACALVTFGKITPVRMMDIASTFSCNIGLTLVIAAAIFLDSRLPKSYRMSTAGVVASWLALVALATFSVISIIQMV